MSNKHSGLGMGLGALIKQNPASPADDAPTAKQQGEQMPMDEKERVLQLAIADIRSNRSQPRQDFDETALSELADSIKEVGVLQPVLVRRIDEGEGYELIAGERRFRAAQQAGMETIPAILRELTDQQSAEIALIENLQREDLNPLEEARAYRKLMENYHLTQEAVAEAVGCSRPHVANALRLLKLAPVVQGQIANGVLLMGQARPLVSLDSHALQEEAAEVIAEKDLSARECEALVKKMQANPEYLKGQKITPPKPPRDIYIMDAEERLNRIFGTKVSIHPGQKKSRIEIEFYSKEDLERIVEELAGREKSLIEQKKEALRKFSAGTGSNPNLVV